MILPRLLLALAVATPLCVAQLPSIAERALKREQLKRDNEARHAAAAEKQKANEEARRKASEERQAAGEEQRAKNAATRADEAAARATAGEERKAASARNAKRPVGQSQGITGPLHEKYMKQVVFVKADQFIENVNEAEFTNEFTLGDPIYFRVFMDMTGPTALAKVVPDMEVNDLALQLVYGIRFTLDNQPTMDLKFSQFSSRVNNMEWTTWRGYFIKHPNAEITSDQGGDVFREFVARASQKGWLTPGRHQLKVEIYPWMQQKEKPPAVGDVLAIGTVTMHAPAGVIQASNPVLCSPHKAAQKDPALEAQILRYANTAWKPTEYRPASVVLTNNAWTIYRHPISGIITRRMMEAVVLSKGAAYCKYQGYQFSQVFEGNSYASGTFTSAEPFSRYMPCACLAK